MRAAVLTEFGTPLVVRDVPAPVLGTGEVIVDVVATMVLPYAGQVFAGERNYSLALPVVPGLGAVGRIRATGPDATHLKPGDWVHCDPTVRSRDGLPAPDITLQGWSGRGPGGLRLQEYFGQGSFAEQMLVPTENVFPLGEVDPAAAAQWCAIGVCLVPFGGLLAGDLRAGETILISGATGNFGSAAVAVALAMGAGCVVAPGRNEKMLAELESRFGPRIRPVVLTGDEDTDRERMKAAAPGAIDIVLDLLPPEAPARAVRAAAMTVREFGRIVLMGGVGMLGGDDLGLPYPWIMRNSVTIRGQWMYPPAANVALIKLVRAGVLDLSQFEITEFPLAEAVNAIEHAAAAEGRFRMTTIRP
jgi:alcohol dehydrogenase